MALGASAAAPLAGSRPNIVFILTDDQGCGDISAHGNPILQTPNLDRLHREGVRFADFHISPTCAPTRSALLTGRHEFKNGVTHTIWHLVSADGGREPQWQLFDVGADPGEKNNVAAANPDVVGSLARSFDGWWQDVQPMLVNEKEVGPRLNPFKELYWKQLGGGPSPELLREMDPARPLEQRPSTDKTSK